MDSNEIRDRLLLIARDRLRYRPGAYGQFQYAIENTVQGMALTVHALSMPYVWQVSEQMGDPRATERIREHLTCIVDEWAQSQPLPPAVEPLPGAEPPPISPARADTKDTASPAPVLTPKAKRRTWWDVSSAYIVEVIQAGQYATCKELYRVLEAKAGPDSPFDKGTGASRGSLFVREISQPLNVKTIQNKWSELRELAQK